MRLLNAVPAIFMVLLAAGILFGTAGLSFWDGFTPGARFFPGWLAGVGVILAVLLVISQWRGTDIATLDLPDAQGAAKVFATTGGLIVLALLAKPIGMVPAMAAFVLFVLLVVLRARLWPSLLTALIIVTGIEVIFVRWLAVPLPAPFFL
jgi:hypothetical protein